MVSIQKVVVMVVTRVDPPTEVRPAEVYYHKRNGAIRSCGWWEGMHVPTWLSA